MNERKKQRRSRAGVTLIEMLVVVVIIGLFAALVSSNLFRQSDKARITATRAQLNMFRTALGQYNFDTGVFHTTEQGLQALRVRPANVNQWDGPYLSMDVPLDPWGRPYTYKFPGEHGDEPDLTSYGADGQSGGEGINADIVSWKNN